MKFFDDVRKMPLWVAMFPVVFLLIVVLGVVTTVGAWFVADYSWVLLLGASVAAVAVTRIFGGATFKGIRKGILRSAKQTLPAVPVLLLIGTVSATWMLSGVVPLLIEYGLDFITPRLFLLTTCCVCAGISLLTGSSWTTIGTFGVAFMGIGSMLGYSPGWIAGAIISGAYFGDKMSPLSDTTVLASSSAGVELFTHIRYMLLTTIPSLLIALIVFGMAGGFIELNAYQGDTEILHYIESTFNLNPLILVIPVLTLILISLRINTLITLAISTALGLGGVFVFQPHLLGQLLEGSYPPAVEGLMASLKMLFFRTSLSTGNPAADELVATGGMAGMMSTVGLVLSAMTFGGILFGSGALERITEAITQRLRRRVSAVTTTAAAGLFFNCATADQYLSIIIGGNMFKRLYERLGLEGRLLSRTVEDSTSVTSVLIPWNSCGLTHSAVLGVGTLTYLPYCVFNYVSPLMSCLLAVAATRSYRGLRGVGGLIRRITA